MIERRRLFFGSDFLRDITQPALFRTVQLACTLSRNEGITFARHPNGRHKAE